MQKKPAYFADKDEKLIFTGGYMEIYIPDSLFTSGIATVIGEKVETMGLFNFRVMNKATDKRESSPVKTFKFPSKMITKPNVIETETLELIKGSGEEKYYVLKYFNGDVVMTSTNAIATVDNVETFIKMLNDGKIPSTIPYDNLLPLMIKNLEINSVNLQVSATLMSCIISELYRSKKNIAKPFRQEIGKSRDVSVFAYTNVNNRTVCSMNSTFSALTFEDIDSMITSSINKNRYGRNQAYTPVEELIKV